jgi:hypothetical protein
VLVGLSCGISSFARVTDELLTRRTVVALRRGLLALLVRRLAEFLASLSSDPAFEEQTCCLYRQSGGANPLSVNESIVRLLVETEVESVVLEPACAAEGSETVCKSKENKGNTRAVGIAAHSR